MQDGNTRDLVFSVPFLIDMLQDEHGDVRAGASEALGLPAESQHVMPVLVASADDLAWSPVSRHYLLAGPEGFVATLETAHTVKVEPKPWMLDGTHRLVRGTAEMLPSIIDDCIASGLYALDLETTGLDSRVFDGETVAKIVGCCRGDPLNVSREAASARGIPILYAPGRNADAVADLTLGFILCLARNIVTTNLRMRTGVLQIESPKDLLTVFDEYGGFELGSSTIGLVGFGAVGRRVAARLKPEGSTALSSPFSPVSVYNHKMTCCQGDYSPG
jgi:hypothetical protein